MEQTVTGVLNVLSDNVPTSKRASRKRTRDSISKPILEPLFESNEEKVKQESTEDSTKIIKEDTSDSGSFFPGDGPGSNSEESSRDGSEFVTAEMIAVEAKLKNQLEKDQLRRERQTEALANAVTEEELTKSRYKRLMHLLGRSTFYSNFMKDKLEELKTKKAPIVKKRLPNKTREVSQPSSKPKPDVKSPPLRPKRLKHTDRYDITEIVNNLDIVSSSDDDSDDIFPVAKSSKQSNSKHVADGADTYVNSMGFTVPALQPQLFEGGIMREHQIDGLEWLKILDSNSVSGILGDEMGLGKTIQVIALIAHLVGMKSMGPFLIIAPLSTIPNWMSEFQRFAPQIPVLLLHGSAEARRKVIGRFKPVHSVNGAKVYPVVITSFQIPMVETKFFLNRKWRNVIVDEGHRLKNHNSLLSQQLRCYNSANRLILTGTPLQNNLAELWALLNFLLPEIFNDLASFESWFNCKGLMAKGAEARLLAKEQEHQILTTMHQILSPFLLRRTKADVSLNLPPKKEMLVFCPLSALQQKLYSAVLDKSIELLIKKKEEEVIDVFGVRPKRRCVAARVGRSYAVGNPEGMSDEDNVEAEPVKPEIKDVICVDGGDEYNFRTHLRMTQPEMMMRHIVNHPYLVHMPLDPCTAQPRIDEEFVASSGKLLVLDAMLARLKQGGHKVLLFSGFTLMLDLLADFLELRGYEYCSLNGRMKLEDRQSEIRRFNTDPDVFVFLVSTRAGGLGINLTAADTVITYDSDWNPQADLQAQDRCHRIGQTRPVVVYRFITKGTIDQVIIERATAKRKLERLIIQPGAFRMGSKTSTSATPLDLEGLRSLLQSSPFNAEMHANGFVFNDTELHNLLDRSDMLEAMRLEEEKQAAAKLAAETQSQSE